MARRILEEPVGAEGRQHGTLQKALRQARSLSIGCSRAWNTVPGVGRTHKGPIARLKGLDQPKMSVAFEGLPAGHIGKSYEHTAGRFPKVANREVCPGGEEQGFCSKIPKVPNSQGTENYQPCWRAWLEG